MRFRFCMQTTAGTPRVRFLADSAGVEEPATEKNWVLCALRVRAGGATGQSLLCALRRRSPARRRVPSAPRAPGLFLFRQYDP